MPILPPAARARRPRSAAPRPSYVASAACLLFGALLAACSNGPAVTPGCPEAGFCDACVGNGCTVDTGIDAGSDAGFDAGARDVGTDLGSPLPDAGTDPDAGPMPDAQTGGPDASMGTTLDDYYPCRSAVDCPSSLGTCLTSLPLHHGDATGTSRVPTSTVFPSLGAGMGICAYSCERDPRTCDNVVLPTPGGSSTCQVVYAASVGTVNADLDAAELAMLTAGTPFAAICRPRLGAIGSARSAACFECALDGECVGGSCWDVAANAAPTAGAGRCVEYCTLASDCPLGFVCTADGTGTSRCLPSLGTCGACVDRDDDGYGVGFCDEQSGGVTPYDCDDLDVSAYFDPLSVNHSLPAYCGPKDLNCDGTPDDLQQVGSEAYGAYHCSACGDACTDSGSGTTNTLTRCVSGGAGPGVCTVTCSAGYLDCDANAADCERSENDPASQWFLDADRDGYPCAEGAAGCTVLVGCVNPSTPTESYVPGPGAASCPGTTCVDARDDDPSIHPGAREVCDGKDNDQSGSSDEGFVGSASVCVETDALSSSPSDCAAGNTRTTLGAACQAACSGGQQAGTWQCLGDAGIVCEPTTAQPIEVACNGTDDDCDQQVDEFADPTCTVSPAPAIPSACDVGTRTCNGAAEVCAPGTVAAFTFDPPGDGRDDNCDGFDADRSGIFVVPNTSTTPSGNGTLVTPFNNLQSAITLANDRLDGTNGQVRRPNVSIYVAAQTNSGSAIPPATLRTTLVVRAGLHLYGGFKLPTTMGAEWTLEANVRSTICSYPAASAPEYVGFRCRATGAADPLTQSTPGEYVAALEHLELRVAAAGTPCPTTITLSPGTSLFGGTIVDCDALKLDDLQITTGTAGAGTPGVAGANGGKGDNGSAGTDSNAGAGGSGGGNGGNGGAGGFGAQNGRNGVCSASGGTAGSGGGAAGGLDPVASDGDNATDSGSEGSNGVIPTVPMTEPTGPAGARYPRLPRTVMAPQTYSLALDPATGLLWGLPSTLRNGGSGGDGDSGCGGGGGGGAARTDIFGTIVDNLGGGGGGEGGVGGKGGTGGGAGGNNVCLTVFGTDFSVVGRVTCNVGAAGAGGKGGSGGDGGSGGSGGAGFDDPTAGKGGKGGGGSGGCGGGAGAGGPGGYAAGILYSPTAVIPFSDWTVMLPAMEAAGGSNSSVTAGDSAMTGTGADCSARPGSGPFAGPGGINADYAQLPVRTCADLAASDSDVDTSTPRTSDYFVNTATSRLEFFACF